MESLIDLTAAAGDTCSNDLGVHVEVEVWRHILRHISFWDRHKAWFTFRLICHTSKDAIEEASSRYYLPPMRLIVTEGSTAGVYCFRGLSADIDQAHFAKHSPAASNLNVVARKVDMVLKVKVQKGTAKRYTAFDTYPGAPVTCIRGNPLGLSALSAAARDPVVEGLTLPWKCILSKLLRDSMQRRTFSWSSLRGGQATFIAIESDSEISEPERGDAAWCRALGGEVEAVPGGANCGWHDSLT